MNNKQKLTAIAEDLMNAYRETEYTVNIEPLITLRVGQKSDALIALHKRHRVESSALITAYNPYSESTLDAKNAQLQSDLYKELQTRSLTFLDGQGLHPSNMWPAEPSFLVLGLSLEASKILGIKFQQNAILWSDKDGIPQLVLLR
ncbi:MAG: DUF3293 domain-containing protein [Methylophilus sp.]|nr:MAG: DUF3293 domain-containing protein [Methylophilus sp.]